MRARGRGKEKKRKRRWREEKEEVERKKEGEGYVKTADADGAVGERDNVARDEADEAERGDLQEEEVRVSVLARIKGRGERKGSGSRPQNRGLRERGRGAWRVSRAFCGR
jgi:hypothetical protein